ncbi:MAG: hypothetical protein A4E39_00960 [Methanoregulaceae archaeon PtaB.Bin152]|nr:MAG: hypothetical protein A4E39_00960 [Methanoregulaceae archaeon PtaB.Bin152]
MWRSMRPGRIRAGSSMSGRFVAPITVTSFNSSSPSSSVRIWLTTLSVTCEEPMYVPRLGTSASTSSKKMIAGDACRALRKISRTPFSDSPTHLERSSGPFTEMKLHSLSFATAFASIVFPVPGGPKRRMPFGGLVPSFAKTCG